MRAKIAIEWIIIVLMIWMGFTLRSRRWPAFFTLGVEDINRRNRRSASEADRLSHLAPFYTIMLGKDFITKEDKSEVPEFNEDTPVVIMNPN